jgi:hypothetical protein
MPTRFIFLTCNSLFTTRALPQTAPDSRSFKRQNASSVGQQNVSVHWRCLHGDIGRRRIAGCGHVFTSCRERTLFGLRRIQGIYTRMRWVALLCQCLALTDGLSLVAPRPWSVVQPWQVYRRALSAMCTVCAVLCLERLYASRLFLQDGRGTICEIYIAYCYKERVCASPIRFYEQP